MGTLSQWRPVLYMLVIGSLFWWATTNGFVNLPENLLTVGVLTLVCLLLGDALTGRAHTDEGRYWLFLVLTAALVDVLHLVLATSVMSGFLHWVSYMVSYLASDLVMGLIESISRPQPTPAPVTRQRSL